MLCPLRLEISAFSMGSPPAIDLALVKKHCRVDFADNDDLLDAYIAAAVNWCEHTTLRAIFSRAHAWVLREFNHDGRGEIRLPRGKTGSVSSIMYWQGGQELTIRGPSSSPSGTAWQEDLRADTGGVLMPPRGQSWPSVDTDVPAPVVINFTAGWAAADVPADLLHAIWFCIADAYDLRGSNDMTPALLNGAGSRLAAREALVSPYRLTRFYS